eukprot:10425619-Alexandrium_andersonii.AAC.1
MLPFGNPSSALYMAEPVRRVGKSGRAVRVLAGQVWQMRRAKSWALWRRAGPPTTKAPGRQ